MPTRRTKPTTLAATYRRPPNRLLIALAAGWMILSLAIGGAVTAESRADVESSAVTTTVAQP